MNGNTHALLCTVASRALAAGTRLLDDAANRAGAPAPNDARLLALERTHAAYEADLANRPRDTELQESVRERLMDEQTAVLTAMARIPADTLTGAAAKARVTARHRRDLMTGDVPTRMQADVLDHVAGAVAGEASQDLGAHGTRR